MGARSPHGQPDHSFAKRYHIGIVMMPFQCHMAITARLPEGLKAEAEAYARSLGISLNALLAISLRDYLDGRRPPDDQATPTALFHAAETTGRNRPDTLPAVASVTSPSAVRVAPNRSEPTETELYALRMRPPLGARGLCGCGSGKRWNQCHGRALLSP